MGTACSCAKGSSSKEDDSPRKLKNKAKNGHVVENGAHQQNGPDSLTLQNASVNGHVRECDVAEGKNHFFTDETATCENEQTRGNKLSESEEGEKVGRQIVNEEELGGKAEDSHLSEKLVVTARPDTVPSTPSAAPPPAHHHHPAADVSEEGRLVG